MKPEVRGLPTSMLGVCKIEFCYESDELLNVRIFLRRPGLLIGKAGATINHLARYLNNGIGDMRIKISPIEFTKEEKIILLIKGKYRFITATRINEFVKSVNIGILAFPGNFRQI